MKARWLLANLAQHAARGQLAATPSVCWILVAVRALFLRVLRRLGFTGELHGCDISSGMLAEAVRTWSRRSVTGL